MQVRAEEWCFVDPKALHQYAITTFPHHLSIKEFKKSVAIHVQFFIISTAKPLSIGEKRAPSFFIFSMLAIKSSSYLT
jgi:hypothetical protein